MHPSDGKLSKTSTVNILTFPHTVSFATSWSTSPQRNSQWRNLALQVREFNGVGRSICSALSFAAPRTPRRLPIQLQEQTDADASVSITINVPANLAADTEISVVLTPRSSRIARSLPPQITPLRFQPVAPGPPRPTTPSPSPLPSPVCQRAPRRPPVVCLIQLTDLTPSLMENNTDPRSIRSRISSPTRFLASKRPRAQYPYQKQEILLRVPGFKNWCILGFLVRISSTVNQLYLIHAQHRSYITTISKDIGGHWRKADTYEQAVEKWNATDTSQREIFNGD